MPRPEGRFPPTRRVRKRAEYQRIQREARRVTTPGFVLLVCARDDQAGARLGIVVSRKVGGAVIRNRAKRLIREAFRATPALWPADVDVIVIAKRPTGEAGLARVIEELQGARASLEKRYADARKDRASRAAGASAGGAEKKAQDSRDP